MAGLRFADLQSRPTEFLDFTSLTLEQTLLQKTAAAGEQTGHTSAVADTGQDAQPRTGYRVQAMVSRYRGRGVT
jgi:hypothetical protein